MSHPPLVSVAIPLFQSKPFVDIIAENIRTIDYPNVEIIISDRHGADDTIEVLRHTFPDDPRLRFVVNPDRVNWV